MSTQREQERQALEQAARLLRSWAGDRQRASGKWTLQEQAAVECAIKLEAMLANMELANEGSIAKDSAARSVDS